MLGRIPLDPELAAVERFGAQADAFAAVADRVMDALERPAAA